MISDPGPRADVADKHSMPANRMNFLPFSSPDFASSGARLFISSVASEPPERAGAGNRRATAAPVPDSLVRTVRPVGRYFPANFFITSASTAVVCDL